MVGLGKDENSLTRSSDVNFLKLTCANNRIRSCCPYPISSSRQRDVASVEDLALSVVGDWGSLSLPVDLGWSATVNPWGDYRVLERRSPKAATQEQMKKASQTSCLRRIERT